MEKAPRVREGKIGMNVLFTKRIISVMLPMIDQVQAKDYELASSLERELASFLRKTGLDFEGDGK